MQSTQVVFDGVNNSTAMAVMELSAVGVGGIIARVTMAGVCGTDSHRLAGHVRRRPWPITFGHESVGAVAEAVAAAMDWRGTPLSPGDRVVWFPASAGCAKCVECQDRIWALSQHEHWPYPASPPNPAGFHEFATLSPRVPVYRCDDQTSDEAHTALGCALPTAIEGLDVIGPS